jgi:hypothetical protein
MVAAFTPAVKAGVAGRAPGQHRLFLCLDKPPTRKKARRICLCAQHGHDLGGGSPPICLAGLQLKFSHPSPLTRTFQSGFSGNLEISSSHA